MSESVFPYILQTVKFGLREFLAYFPSAQNSLRNQFLHRFSNHFAVLPAQFSTRDLQILLLSRTERLQYNPCGFALHLDSLMKQGQEQCETHSHGPGGERL